MSKYPDLFEQAHAVLKLNDQKTFTIPAEGLYPHQWLWDSCFIAIGLSHINVPRAKREIKSLLRGQWSNGMLPNMIFDDALFLNQDRNIWRSHLSVNAPEKVSTSGITQPPMLAEAVVRIGAKMTKGERRTWYKSMLPALISYHSWLYTERDPNQSGLITLIHPYESGMDSTPPWINQLHKHHRPWWVKPYKTMHLDFIVNHIRRDTRHVPPGQRMETLDALLYYDVIRTLRDKHYDISRIFKKTQFTIQDLGFNSIFIRANQLMIDMAEFSGYELPVDLVERMTQSRVALEMLWDSYSGQYLSKNFKTNTLIREPTIATLLPLYAGVISKERADKLVSLLLDDKKFMMPHPIPSVPRDSKHFEPERYWQGPAWININWLVIDGLERYGYSELANAVRDKSLELVATHGSYEYFSPIDGTPAGAANFSWTAALAIDLLSR